MPYNQERFLASTRDLTREYTNGIYQQIVRMFEDGINNNQDDDDEDGENHDVASHKQRVQQASDQQIDLGEKYLRDGEVVRYAADQTANNQEFVMDNDEFARGVITEGEASYVAASVYEKIYNDQEEELNRIVENMFLLKAGILYEEERERMRGVYGASLPEEEDETDVELVDVDLNKGFTRRGW